MMHYGVDFVAPLGTPVICTADGVKDKAEFQKGYGNMVFVRHGEEYATLYEHLQEFIVSLGQKVEKGQVIGYLGESGISIGPHLHYEVIRNGERVNPEGYF